MVAFLVIQESCQAGREALKLQMAWRAALWDLKGWLHGWALPLPAIGRGGLQPLRMAEVSSGRRSCAAALSNAHLVKGKRRCLVLGNQLTAFQFPWQLYGPTKANQCLQIGHRAQKGTNESPQSPNLRLQSAHRSRAPSNRPTASAQVGETMCFSHAARLASGKGKASRRSCGLGL